MSSKSDSDVGNFGEYYDLGIGLELQGKIEEAIASYQKALNHEPSLVNAHLKLGSLLQRQGKIDQAIASFQSALDAGYSSTGIHFNLGCLFHDQGQTDKAISSYQAALECDPKNHLAKLNLVMAQLPIIYHDESELKLRRNNYQQHLQELTQYYQSANESQRQEAADCVGATQPFFLAYQGLCDRDLQQTYGSMLHLLMSSRYPQWCQPLPIKNSEAKRKIRVGFVSGFFFAHSVWKIPLQGWLENLDRSEFELFGYFTGSRQDAITTKAAKIFDRFDYSQTSIEQWAEKIVADNLDIIIFSEFGMDSMTVKLGSLRLAPVQIAFGGHPETSGLPTIDYHLSSDLMESTNAQSHYTEKLIRLPNLAVSYRHLVIKPEVVTRKALGLQEDEILFWCCQSLFKYLPQHDDLFPRIAQKLSAAKFVFIKLESELANDIFSQRLARSFQNFNLNYQDYCLFLPRLNAHAFLGTTAIADVFLDNIGWSGNNTTMESTLFNLPIVTLPGEMMRSRHTMAILTMMGIKETIAQNKEQYIEIALRLGQDVEYRKQISQKIALNKGKLYEDLAPVRALEDFLFNVLNRQRKSTNSQVIEAFQLARKLQQSNRLQDSKLQYLRVLEVEPDHAETLYSLGMIAQKQKALAEAEQYLQTSVSAQPQLLKAWFSLGNLFQSQAQFFEAEQSYRRALSLRSDSAPIYNNLGYVLQKQEKWSAAASYYKKALELMPNCLEAKINWKNALFAQGKLSLDEQRDYANSNCDLGLGRHQEGDYQTAEIYYRQAIAMRSDFLEAHYYLGLALQAQRKLDSAFESYQQVLQLDPDFGGAYYNLGRIHQDQGELELATTNFKQGLKLLNPNYASALEAGTTLTSFADDFTIPETNSAEIEIAGHKFPVIPKLSAGDDKRPFWSVVIPVVNRPEYFPECLASVLAQWQNHEDMEIIILDNGSEPPQWQIPDTLGRGIIRYYRFPKTVPLQANWNTAVSLCRGQWIHLLHHDDYILPEFYSRLRASLETCPSSVGAAFTAHHVITEDRQIVYTEDHGLNNCRGVVPNWICKMGVVNTTSPPSVVIKRSAYEELGGYKLDILYTCDWELYKRVASFCDWWYEPQILAHYRHQANSITIAENTNGASGLDHLKAIEISQSYLPQEYCAEITTKSRVNYFHWCLTRAAIPLKSGNFDGAFQLIQAAIKIDSSPDAIAKLSSWLDQDEIAPLKNQVLDQLEGMKELVSN